MKNRNFFIVAVLLAIFDIFTKFMAKLYFLNEAGEVVKSPVEIIGNYFRLNFVYNPGVAFGIRVGGRYLLSAITIVLIIFIMVVLYKIDIKRKIEKFAYTLILGGALGNFYDRAVYGKVVDFFDSDFPDFIMERWPVFNVADSYVSIGMGLLILQYFILDPLNRRKNRLQEKV